MAAHAWSSSYKQGRLEGGLLLVSHLWGKKLKRGSVKHLKYSSTYYIKLVTRKLYTVHSPRQLRGNLVTFWHVGTWVRIPVNGIFLTKK